MNMKLELDLNQLLGLQYDEEGEPVGRRELRSEVVQTMTQQLLRETREEVKKSVCDAVLAEVRAEVKNLVREAMAQPIQKTSTWGEKQGPPTTLLELIRTSVEGYFNNPTRRDSYNRDPQNLRELIDESVKELLTVDLRKEIATIKKTINTELQGRAMKAAAEALLPTPKV